MVLHIVYDAAGFLVGGSQLEIFFLLKINLSAHRKVFVLDLLHLKTIIQQTIIQYIQQGNR